jgi:SAM-dependent methyltransferase
MNKSQVLVEFASGNTVWRSFMNAELQSGLQLRSPVLDLGSGEVGSSSYHQIIPDFHKYQVDSVDICAEKKPTKVADIQQGIPFEAERFHTCLAFNIFEHLYEFEKVLHEIFRVLTPQGKLYIAVPFLFRVHAAPSDYFRYTKFALESNLSNVGFVEIKAKPCGGGAVTAALAQIDFLIPTPFRGSALQIVLALDKQIAKRSGGVYRNANDYPLNYFVTAIKP